VCIVLRRITELERISFARVTVNDVCDSPLTGNTVNIIIIKMLLPVNLQRLIDDPPNFVFEASKHHIKTVVYA